MVSAHYPPNFTSGGTLVPQRMARGLVELGHDVTVYAGHLDASVEPLTTWEETDPYGVRVRWVSTTPWTAWSDERNFDNPDVAADFAAWVLEERPDVVHLHSLQTLGGGLVPAARASGAAVVVTMHDFWWTCARQFLVDQEMRPCSLVVDCGSCACQVDHAWLLRRNRRLAEQLAAADLVLAPSESAARVMAANGVDPARLRVDENGVPDARPAGAPVGRSERAADGTVRFMFAGGEDPMKGLPVLLDALPAVRPAGRWSVDLYNVERNVAHPQAHPRPAYAPDDLSDVLAAHDVLVLPSVMRESHSILTREALGAGLAVICSDSLGPEEAVTEGVNGLVVPAGDAAALAAAMTRVVDDPALLAGMRAHAVEFRARTVEDQVAGLDAMYSELLGAQDDAARLRTSQRELEEVEDDLLGRVLFVVGIGGAPLRYRAQLPAEALASLGVDAVVRHYRDPEILSLADEVDAVVLYRVPATHEVASFVERVRARDRAVPVLFDIDDLIVDPGLRGQVHGLDGLTADELDLWWRGVARYRTTLEMCDGYIGSTNELCARVGALTGMPTYRFANGVGAVLGRISERAMSAPRTPGPLRIGYFSGTTTHDADWALVEPAVARVLARHPDVELWLGGHLRTGDALAGLGDRVRRFPMMAWTELPTRLRQLDVNLAPLVPDSVFNEAKSAIKWLEAALVATPTVASPTEPFREAIEDGVTGLLAVGVDDWEKALEALLTDDAYRERMGARARRAALLRWAPSLQGRVYRRILRDALEHNVVAGGPRVSAWEPVLDHEPWEPAAHVWVDAYPPRGDEVVHHHPLRLKAMAARRVLAQQGVGGLARAAWRRLR
ncbi:glycosyltransferase [Cellulomonas sp. zg-ZUI199]|uniref:Glycosyltransferase n=1 Tax=Cellulomonas wangleii TaxID=2816956 RepID=A0ABX8DA27_9CELL|nr:glycosyltransferase [Cellulomonas wangleii]QVI64274.1 glycosyltransferase [Cellulomonas wangleii]